MHLALASLFRNLPPASYLEQTRAFEALCRDAGHRLTFLLAYGDCGPEVPEALAEVGADYRLVEASHGGPKFGSVEDPVRMRQLSFVLNRLFDAVTTEDAVIYVESDLLWTPDTLVRLLSMGKDVVAPLIFRGNIFYDTWGFRRLDGTRFPAQGLTLQGVTEVGSVGSCFVAQGDVARRCRVRDDNALVGWCRDVREQGYRIWVEPAESVQHPMS